MMAKFRLLVLVLLTLASVGCGNSASQRLIGKWKYDAAKAAGKAAGKLMGENADGKAAAAVGMMQTMGMKMEIVIEFKADQTANFTATGIPSPYPGSVNWKVVDSQGDKVTVEFNNSKENLTNKVQITFTDNDQFQFSPPDSNAKSMEFERVKE